MPTKIPALLDDSNFIIDNFTALCIPSDSTPDSYLVDLLEKFNFHAFQLKQQNKDLSYCLLERNQEKEKTINLNLALLQLAILLIDQAATQLKSSDESQLTCLYNFKEKLLEKNNQILEQISIKEMPTQAPLKYRLAYDLNSDISLYSSKINIALTGNKTLSSHLPFSLSNLVANTNIAMINSKAEKTDVPKKFSQNTLITNFNKYCALSPILFWRREDSAQTRSLKDRLSELDKKLPRNHNFAYTARVSDEQASKIINILHETIFAIDDWKQQRKGESSRYKQIHKFGDKFQALYDEWLVKKPHLEPEAKQICFPLKSTQYRSKFSTYAVIPALNFLFETDCFDFLFDTFTVLSDLAVLF